MAFSDSGEWLALVPNSRGMLVIRTAELSSPEARPTLENPVLDRAGTDDWDFFFTAHDQLVVQRGNQLLVGSPEATSESDFWRDEELELPAIPACSRGWYPTPEAWCGAPAPPRPIRL